MCHPQVTILGYIFIREHQEENCPLKGMGNRCLELIQPTFKYLKGAYKEIFFTRAVVTGQAILSFKLKEISLNWA